MENLYINGNELPDALSNEEICELINKIKNGDKESWEKVLIHNIRLVLYEVSNTFKNVEYDKNDLVSIGIFGLIKAINGYDVNKKTKFYTYAVKCVDNEISMFLRKINKDKILESLNKVIAYDNKDNELKLEDILSNNLDLAENYNKKETYLILRELVSNLPEIEKKIIVLYFGLNNNKPYKQKEIADELSVSQSYVSKLISSTAKKLKLQLEKFNVAELRNNRNTKSKMKIK